MNIKTDRISSYGSSKRTLLEKQFPTTKNAIEEEVENSREK